MSDFQVEEYKDMELSTQLIIKESLKRGVKVEVLDRKEQFIRLSKDGRSEYVREATKTSLDSYITSLLLENKWVAKILMQEAGVKTPKAHLISDAAQADEIFSELEDFGWVVKPKSTNFGIGVHIFSNKPEKNEFVKAALDAAKHGDVLVEEYVEGPEYRFLIMGDECVAVLNRVPANVIGDGKSTIAELVTEKNRHPWRGQGYKTPLEKIQMGKEEEGVLSDHNLDFDSVPDEGMQAFLRNNSNISTGGDSLDVSDTMHDYYKEEAVKAAKSVGAVLCGVDIIIPKTDAPDDYAVIELNFNPVLYFHDFPFVGKNRGSAKHLMDLLGF